MCKQELLVFILQIIPYHNHYIFGLMLWEFILIYIFWVSIFTLNKPGHSGFYTIEARTIQFIHQGNQTIPVLRNIIRTIWKSLPYCKFNICLPNFIVETLYTL